MQFGSTPMDPEICMLYFTLSALIYIAEMWNKADI